MKDMTRCKTHCNLCEHAAHHWNETFEADADDEDEVDIDKPVWVCRHCGMSTPMVEEEECDECHYPLDPEGVCHSCDELVLAVDHGHSEGDP